MMTLETKQQSIRTIIGYLKSAKKEKGNKREYLARTALLLIDCYIVDVYFSICTMEVARSIKSKNKTLVKDINNLINELKQDYDMQETLIKK